MNLCKNLQDRESRADHVHTDKVSPWGLLDLFKSSSLFFLNHDKSRHFSRVACSEWESSSRQWQRAHLCSRKVRMSLCAPSTEQQSVFSHCFCNCYARATPHPERPSRITFSLRTEAEGPVKYLHVREGVDLMEQLRWYELARAKEGQPLTEEGKAELIRTLSLEMLSALGKTEPLSGTTLPRR